MQIYCLKKMRLCECVCTCQYVKFLTHDNSKTTTDRHIWTIQSHWDIINLNPYWFCQNRWIWVLIFVYFRFFMIWNDKSQEHNVRILRNIIGIFLDDQLGTLLILVIIGFISGFSVFHRCFCDAIFGDISLIYHDEIFQAYLRIKRITQ